MSLPAAILRDSAAPRSAVIVVHNHYQQSGGEDQVVQAEVALLNSYGHSTVLYSRHNDAVEYMGGVELARMTLWNQTVYDELRALCRQHQPLAMHVHNTFPLVSPAAYYAARDEGIPVVQTLHNYRLVCPNGLLFRDGHPCEDCLGKRLAWPGVVHACYRRSRPATALSVAMTTAHRARGTWANVVDVYIALSEFARGRFAAGAVPADRIAVKPNFLAHDPGVGKHAGGYALFVGRLSSEKGVRVLTDGWELVRAPRTLKIVGSGPLDAEAARERPGVEWLGRQSTEHVLALMRDAGFLIVPSECYENFPVTIVEAFATGLPVIASRIGSLTELVRDGETGLQFRAGDAADLASKIEWAFAHPNEMVAMGAHARAEFEAKYGAAENYAQLLDIYHRAAERRRAHAHA